MTIFLFETSKKCLLSYLEVNIYYTPHTCNQSEAYAWQKYGVSTNVQPGSNRQISRVELES